MTSSTLDGQTILITGSARRLGAHMARSLHQAGANIVLHCQRSVVEAQSLAEELQEQRLDSVAMVTSDLREEQSEFSIVAAAVQSFGRLDALVNNACLFEPGGMTPADPERWEEVQAINVRAPWLLAEAAASHLREARGCIINVLDIYAARPLRGYLSYSTSQTALAGLTRALALELAPEVRVNGIAPGAILWPDEDDGRDRQAIIDSTALKRLGHPDDIARAAHPWFGSGLPDRRSRTVAAGAAYALDLIRTLVRGLLPGPPPQLAMGVPKTDAPGHHRFPPEGRARTRGAGFPRAAGQNPSPAPSRIEHTPDRSYGKRNGPCRAPVPVQSRFGTGPC